MIVSIFGGNLWPKLWSDQMDSYWFRQIKDCFFFQWNFLDALQHCHHHHLVWVLFHRGSGRSRCKRSYLRQCWHRDWFLKTHDIDSSKCLLMLLYSLILSSFRLCPSRFAPLNTSFFSSQPRLSGFRMTVSLLELDSRSKVYHILEGHCGFDFVLNLVF